MVISPEFPLVVELPLLIVNTPVLRVALPERKVVAPESEALPVTSPERTVKAVEFVDARSKPGVGQKLLEKFVRARETRNDTRV